VATYRVTVETWQGAFVTLADVRAVSGFHAIAKAEKAAAARGLDARGFTAEPCDDVAACDCCGREFTAAGFDCCEPCREDLGAEAY